jgi:hypothetical protein
MWIEKSNAEKTEDTLRRRKKDIRIAIAYWVFFTVFPPLVRNRYLGGMMHRPHLWQMSVPQVLKIYTATMIVSGLGVYFFFWRPRSHGNSPLTLLCPKCGKAKGPDGKLDCYCGGHFVDLRNMKWVEDKPHKA